MNPTSDDLAALIDACFAAPQKVETLVAFNAAFRPYVLLLLAATYPESPAFAEDAYQDAFVTYLKLFRAGKNPKVTNYVTYFVAVAKHCLINQFRKRRTYVPIDRLFEEELPPTGADEERRARHNIDVLEAMTLLPRRCRYILEARYFRNVSDEILAAELGIGQASVPMTVKRCRDRLKEKLEEKML
jgi:RNA polymerase sigma factor (sigma-70 family)